MEKVTESASASEIKTDEEATEVGTQVKGKDFVLLSAPEICFSCPSEDNPLMAGAATAVTDTDLNLKPCGDGLYYFGGDLFCIYPILGTTITDTSVVFDYAPYTVTVSWTNSGDGVRTNPTWQRQYKQIENTENEV